MNKEYRSQAEAIPQEISRLLASDNFLISLPKINNVLKISGGVTHQVFQINAGINKYYLKILINFLEITFSDQLFLKQFP